MPATLPARARIILPASIHYRARTLSVLFDLPAANSRPSGSLCGRGLDGASLRVQLARHCGDSSAGASDGPFSLAKRGRQRSGWGAPRPDPAHWLRTRLLDSGTPGDKRPLFARVALSKHNVGLGTELLMRSSLASNSRQVRAQAVFGSAARRLPCQSKVAGEGLYVDGILSAVKMISSGETMKLWLLGLFYIAAFAALIFAINFCARRASSLPYHAVRAHNPTKDRLLVRRRLIRPPSRGVTSQHIAQNCTGSLHLARPCPSRAIFSLMRLSPATQGCGVMCRPLRVT